MPHGTAIDYNPVQTARPEVNATGGMGVRSNPNDFGAQVSEAETEAGKTGFDLAQKQQGMINETAMTNADADFSTKVGKIKGDYTSLTGQAAFNAFPQYQSDIRAAFQESRKGLPPAAQRGFDMMAVKSMANHIADGSSYASSQLKEANRDSYSNVANADMQSLLDPNVAADPNRSQFHLDSLKFAAQAQIDENHPGLKTDPETGAVSFDESKPEGKAAKEAFELKLNSYLTQGYINKYTTLANTHGAIPAFDQYSAERDKLPRAAQVALDASFAPKIFNAHTETGAQTALMQASQDHADLLYNPASSNALDIVQKNEGKMSGDGQSAYGIDKNAHPKEFAEISSLPDSDKSAYARKFFKEEYWDKKGIANLPADTQSIVMDGAVNHSTEFSDKLIQAAKDGATPQQLIDMRRGEYQRLATVNPQKYGDNLNGWNNRLDNMQSGLAMEGHSKPYGANPDGSPITPADYFRSHSLDVLAKGDAYAEEKMPGDLALKRAVRQSLENYMNKTIANQSAQYVQDNRNVVKAINGGMTKGKIPETEAELRSIPGVASLLDKVAVQDPKFAEGIPVMIAKMARQNTTTNSSNGYDTVLRALEPNDAIKNPNRIESVDHLDKLLGHSDGTGINMKDYNDAKQAIELKDTSKQILLKHMQDITNANGNVDGKGQERALSWYNEVMAESKTNDAKGDKKDNQFWQKVTESYTPPTPGIMTQLSNWFHGTATSSNVSVVSPTGQVGTIPAANLDKALAAGYKKAP